jgi:hypothetical protein
VAKLWRPDINTKFHIDYGWWTEQPRNVRVRTWEHLCPACKDRLGKDVDAQDIDWVDPDTAEVSVVDGLTYSLRECCSQREDYVTRSTPLAASIFRLLIANGNAPLSPLQFHEKIGKSDPHAILRVLLGKQTRTHYGIKPILG